MLRSRFRENIGRVFDANEAGLALGYLLGDKSQLSTELVELIRMVGLSHMVVASGFHLATIVGVGCKIFGKISRAIALFASSLLMVLFMALTGFSVSMLRAGLMSGISLFFAYNGRKMHPARLLIYTASILLLIKPAWLTDVGWILSFASVIGITFLAPLITKFLYGDEKTGVVASSIITSSMALIACLPASIYYFGAVSVLGIPLGLVINPTIAPIMFLTALVGTIAPFLSPLLGALLKLHLFLIRIFAGFK